MKLSASPATKILAQVTSSNYQNVFDFWQLPSQHLDGPLCLQVEHGLGCCRFGLTELLPAPVITSVSSPQPGRQAARQRDVMVIHPFVSVARRSTSKVFTSVPRLSQASFGLCLRLEVVGLLEGEDAPPEVGFSMPS